MNKRTEYQLKYLTEKFYHAYQAEKYPEIERKSDRPYLVFLVKMDGNTYAIPFRTNIKHNWCYKFKNTTRDTKYSTGLDYSKAVIVNESSYIGNDATIDNKEYVELNGKYHFIIKQFQNYLQGYIKYIRNGGNEYDASKYKYSTLQYFHKELGLQK